MKQKQQTLFMPNKQIKEPIKIKLMTIQISMKNSKMTFIQEVSGHQYNNKKISWLEVLHLTTFFLEEWDSNNNSLELKAIICLLLILEQIITKKMHM